MFKYSVNPETGNPQAQFPATLISVSEKVLKNVNDTEYRVATIDFIDESSKEQRVSCLIYENNWKHGMKLGEKYLATATTNEKGVLITLSHLAGSGVRATESMFDFSQAKKEVTKEDLAVKGS